MQLTRPAQTEAPSEKKFFICIKFILSTSFYPFVLSILYYFCTRVPFIDNFLTNLRKEDKNCTPMFARNFFRCSRVDDLGKAVTWKASFSKYKSAATILNFGIKLKWWFSYPVCSVNYFTNITKFSIIMPWFRNIILGNSFNKRIPTRCSSDQKIITLMWTAAISRNGLKKQDSVWQQLIRYIPEI